MNWYLYPHTWSSLLLLWVNYHCPEANSPLLYQILSLLPTGGHCSSNIPLFLLSHHLFYLYWIIPISFQTCYSICPLEKYSPPLIPFLHYLISLLFMAKILQKDTYILSVSSLLILSLIWKSATNDFPIAKSSSLFLVFLFLSRALLSGVFNLAFWFLLFGI